MIMKDIYNRKVSLGDLVIPFMPVTGSLNMDKLLGLVIADNKIFIYSESSSSYIVKNCNFCCLVDKEKDFDGNLLVLYNKLVDKYNVYVHSKTISCMKSKNLECGQIYYRIEYIEGVKQEVCYMYLGALELEVKANIYNRYNKNGQDYSQSLFGKRVFYRFPTTVKKEDLRDNIDVKLKDLLFSDKVYFRYIINDMLFFKDSMLRGLIYYSKQNIDIDLLNTYNISYTYNNDSNYVWLRDDLSYVLSLDMIFNKK